MEVRGGGQDEAEKRRLIEGRGMDGVGSRRRSRGIEGQGGGEQRSADGSEVAGEGVTDGQERAEVYGEKGGMVGMEEEARAEGFELAELHQGVQHFFAVLEQVGLVYRPAGRRRAQDVHPEPPSPSAHPRAIPGRQEHVYQARLARTGEMVDVRGAKTVHNRPVH